jgi:hypothetical protein
MIFSDIWVTGSDGVSSIDRMFDDQAEAAVAALEAALDGLLGVELAGLVGRDLVELLERVEVQQRRRAVVDHRLIAEVDVRGVAAEFCVASTVVYPAHMHSSTMRAEMARLRHLLGRGVLQSRPYRLTVETECDWQTVPAHLAAGRVRDALHAYHGPLLPQSEAPGIVERREALQRQLRAAVLTSGQVDLMVAWTRSRWGADDLPMWREQAGALPAASPLRPLAAAEALRLERELGDRRRRP